MPVCACSHVCSLFFYISHVLSIFLTHFLFLSLSRDGQTSACCLNVLYVSHVSVYLSSKNGLYILAGWGWGMGWGHQAAQELFLTLYSGVNPAGVQGFKLFMATITKCKASVLSPVLSFWLDFTFFKGGTSSSTQGFLLALSSRLTPGRVGRPFGDPGNKPRLIACNAYCNALRSLGFLSLNWFKENKKKYNVAPEQ